MKKRYVEPTCDIIVFVADETITDSGDYQGINFESLV